MLGQTEGCKKGRGWAAVISYTTVGLVGTLGAKTPSTYLWVHKLLTCSTSGTSDAFVGGARLAGERKHKR